MNCDDFIDVRARTLSADALDAVRPLARRYGFNHTNSGVVRFSVMLAAEISSAERDTSVADVLARVLAKAALTRRTARYAFP